MNALPSLKGSLGYIFTSCDLNLMNSKDVPFKNLVERFQIHDQPKKPEGKPEEWLAGKRVDDRGKCSFPRYSTLLTISLDYLLSGLFYIPTGRMDAFYTTRISSTLQASISSITQPHYGTTPMANSGELGSGSLLLSLQHDTGRWCTEYLWDSDGGIWGARVLRNFGKLATSITGGGDMDNVEKKTGVKRVDEEEAMEGGLRGRISAGAEIYASAEKSAGSQCFFVLYQRLLFYSVIYSVSFGIRFTTLPDNSSLSVAIQDPMSSTTAMATSLNATNTLHPPPLNQPPTVITAIFSPITGHILTSYAARVSQDLALCSRFSFNINSYESEWTMGAEWWMKDRATSFSEPNATNSETLASTPSSPREIQAVLKARISTSAVRKLLFECRHLNTPLQDMAFLWEGRLRNALVSMGVISNLSNRSRPIAAIGLELAYFSSE